MSEAEARWLAVAASDQPGSADELLIEGWINILMGLDRVARAIMRKELKLVPMDIEHPPSTGC